jgi:hypothetical protein
LNTPNCGKLATCDHKCTGSPNESCGGYCAVNVFTFRCSNVGVGDYISW